MWTPLGSQCATQHPFCFWRRWWWHNMCIYTFTVGTHIHQNPLALDWARIIHVHSEPSLPGHSHRCNTLILGIFSLSWHITQLLGHNSISSSSCDNIFIKWDNEQRTSYMKFSDDPYASLSVKYLNTDGITTRDPHKTFVASERITNENTNTDIR